MTDQMVRFFNPADHTWQLSLEIHLKTEFVFSKKKVDQQAQCEINWMKKKRYKLNKFVNTKKTENGCNYAN